MHSFSPAVDTSIFHLHSPDLIVSSSPPLFPSFPNFSSSHSSSFLLAYSQLALDPVLESPDLLPLEVISYSGSSGPCSSYGSPTSSQPALIQRSMSSQSLQKDRVRHGPGARISSLIDTDMPAVRRVYSSGDLQVNPKIGCKIIVFHYSFALIKTLHLNTYCL
ncbi:zinc finger protein CONSTANS-LIKE 3-like [Cucumis melo var. makuwa]|uniref:Zinc finger protein CONSTANS-LIKE 3-like n=1 Tax=Cucumis melo var. makuwa TaxID=1194695 RepID=A0A5A7STD4_CUCMM|nr:zinc finger protein CONSTANS-LIKE 3-like [Cucumis melo var. makuwa]TYK01262.1 zinc finger protein CONSTANS-LIKE 3-like [Cucumis melo var. makuwa]